MDTLQASRNQLISEIEECTKMILRLIQLPTHISSHISPSLLPYLSMICDGIDNLFSIEDKLSNSSDFEDINGIPFTTLIKKIRASAKLLTDKKTVNQSINTLNKITQNFHDELIKNYNSEQLKHIETYGQPDLSVFYYKDQAFANSSQTNIYITPFNSNIWEIGSLLSKYSEQLSKYITSFASFNFNMEQQFVHMEQSEFMAMDFIYTNEKHRNIFNNNMNKDISLYLFNMQCQLNFAINVLPLLIDNHSLKHRIQLLIYYYSIQALRYAYKAKHLEQYKRKIIIAIDSCENIFTSNIFRDNLFHYKFSDDIKFSYSENPFETMVKELTSMSVDKLLDIIYNEMKIVEQLIKDIIQ